MKTIFHTELRVRAWHLSVVVHCIIALLFLRLSTVEASSTREKSIIRASIVFKEARALALSRAPALTPSPSPLPSTSVPRPVAAKKAIASTTKQTALTSVSPQVFADGASSQEASSEHRHVGVIRRVSPLLLNHDDVKVPYPEQARHLMIEGVVKMRLTVSEAGRVTNAEILSGPYYGLRNAALIVARKLFFLPATDENGDARTAQIDHEVVFRLNKG